MRCGVKGMMLLVLDKNPTEAALSVPQELRHKQLLELMQMLSHVVDFGYEIIPQGREIKAWICKNKVWVYTYAKVLMHDLNLKRSTQIKYKCLLDLLYKECKDIEESMPLVVPNAKTAIFRYVKEYEDTEYPTNTELPIDIAVKEYEKYVEWKEKFWKKNK